MNMNTWSEYFINELNPLSCLLYRIKCVSQSEYYQVNKGVQIISNSKKMVMYIKAIKKTYLFIQIDLILYIFGGLGFVLFVPLSKHFSLWQSLLIVTVNALLPDLFRLTTFLSSNYFIVGTLVCPAIAATDMAIPSNTIYLLYCLQAFQTKFIKQTISCYSVTDHYCSMSWHTHNAEFFKVSICKCPTFFTMKQYASDEATVHFASTFHWKW